MLTDKCIVVGVTGGIAAYKACELVSRLVKQGADVRVIMTKNATEFVQPLTFQSLSHNPVSVDTFANIQTWEIEHVALAQRADLFIIAPATANVMAKLACGIADDMLTTTVLATHAPVLLAPAMNTGMWENPATQHNLEVLVARGVHIAAPGTGLLLMRHDRCGPHERAGGAGRGGKRAAQGACRHGRAERGRDCRPDCRADRPGALYNQPFVGPHGLCAG